MDVIREKEERLVSLLENIPGIVYRCKFDRDWTMKFLSKNCEEITGYKPEDFIDNQELSWSDIIHSDFRGEVWDEIKRSVEDDEQFQITYKIITKENEERWVWEQGCGIRRDDGEIERVEGVITDITEKVNSRMKLEERETKIKALYKASAKLGRCQTKQDVYKQALKSARDILGFYTSVIFIYDGEALEVKCTVGHSSFTVGQRVSTEIGLKGRCFKNKESFLVKDVTKRQDTGMTQKELKSGVLVPVGDFGIFSTVSREVNHYDEFDLEMAKILASHIKEAVERIENKEEKSLILDTAKECITYLDKDLNIIWTNEEVKRYCAISKEDLKGKKCYNIIRDRDEVCVDCPVKRAIDKGCQQEGIQEVDGKYWLIRATPRIDEKGDVTGIVEVTLDITDRKLAENRLKDSLNKIEGVLEATTKIEKQTQMETIYNTAVQVAEDILNINMGGIFVEEDDKLVLKAASSDIRENLEDFDQDLMKRDKDDGVLGKVWETKKPDITLNFGKSEHIEPRIEGYRSGITVPIGDIGVFQAMSKMEDYFSEEDLNILKLLFLHVREAHERVELLEKLKRNERRYRKLFDKAPIPIWEEDFSEVKAYLEKIKKDKDIDDMEAYLEDKHSVVEECVELLRVKDVNERSIELFEAENKKELIDNFGEIFKERSLEGLRQELVAISEGVDTFETSDMVNYTLSGEKRNFYCKGTTSGETEEKFSHVILSLVDITELKRTQKKLKESEKKYRTIFESTGTAMLIIEEDKTISLVNEEFEKIVGYSKDEIEGKMDWSKFIYEEDKKKMKKYHKLRREGGEAPNRYSFRAINRFGDIRYCLVEISLIPETKKCIVSLTDVTDFRKTFGALRESQESFRVLFENYEDPIILIDRDHKIREANDRLYEILEMPEGQLTDDSYNKFLSEGYENKVKDTLEKLFTGKIEETEIDIDCLTGDGEELSGKADLHIVKDYEDNPLYVILILKLDGI